jgi:NAD(P)-dependent dehydrogenase (short-subunit alcohol dehydrogenase family)
MTLFDDKPAALITGASRGLGRALLGELALAGARVVGVARDADGIARAAAELRAQGYAAHGLGGDVGDKRDIHRITASAAALVGPIDVLVHNASTLGPTPLPLLLDTACEDFEHTLQVNLLGPFRLTKVLAGHMLLSGSGLIVHVSSDAATSAYPGWGAYGVSKAALDHLGRIWAAELAGTGVRFLSIDPGEMDTDMHRAALPEADPATLAAPAEVAARIVRFLARSAHIPSGTRLEAARLEAA